MEARKNIETELVVLKQKQHYSERKIEEDETKIKAMIEEHDKRLKMLKEEKDIEIKEALQKIMDDKAHIDNKYQKLKVEHKESEEKLKKGLIEASS